MALTKASPQVVQAVARAVALHRSGMRAQAETLYRQVLAQVPEHAEVLNYYGMLKFQKGEPSQAEEFILKAIQINRRLPYFHINLGEIYRTTGRLNESIAAYQRALKLDPNSIEARFCLASALHDQGKLEEAIEAYQGVLRKSPNFPEAHNALGVAYAECEKFEDAQREYQLAIAQRPQYAEAYLNLGNAFDSAACPLSENEKHTQAARHYLKALAIDPGLAEAHLKLGAVLLKQEYTAEALQHFQRASQIRPTWAEAYLNEALALEYLGQPEQAFLAYQKSTDADPTLVEGYYGQAKNKKHMVPDARFLHQAEELLTSNTLESQDAGRLHFALGKVYDDSKDFDQAFRHFAEANRLRAATLPFDAGAHRQQVDRLIAMYDSGFFQAHRHLANPSELPLFIVGLPRSGTTLTEQIISSHPRVFGAGEVPYFPNIEEMLIKQYASAPYPDNIRELPDGEAQRISDDYLVHLASRARGDYQRIVDKMHLNFMSLGLIATLFPRARIVFCRRHALDNGLAIFFQDFSEHYAYSFDLTGLGSYMTEHDRLIAHWQKVLPNPMLEIRYEELVDNPEHWTRRLIAHAGLEWDDACLAPHKLERTVKTASHWQVRQPIYKTSVQRWKNYEKHLGPLKTALGYID